MYDILRFLNFLYLSQIAQFNFFILTYLVIGSILELFNILFIFARRK